MAEDKKEGAEEAKGAGKKSPLMLILVITNIVVVAGAGAAVFFAMSSPSQSAAAADEENPAEIGPLVEMSPIVVNLNESAATNYLRASFQLEVADDEQKVAVEARLVPIRSAIFLYLSELHVDDTRGREQREAVVERVHEIVNEQVGGDMVRRVYIIEFVVQ